MSGLLQKIKHWYGSLKMTKTSYEKKGIKPAQDWTVILIASQIVILISVLSAIYLYIQIDSNRIFIVNDDKRESEVKIKMDLLEKVVDNIKLREQTNLQVRQSTNNPSDPSI